MVSTASYNVLDKAAATGAGKLVFALGYTDIRFNLHSPSGAKTVKFKTSSQEEAPNFDAAQSETNRWDFADVIDLEDGTPIDGDTGIAITAIETRQLELNASGARWLTADVALYTAGTISVGVEMVNPNE